MNINFELSKLKKRRDELQKEYDREYARRGPESDNLVEIWKQLKDARHQVGILGLASAIAKNNKR